MISALLLLSAAKAATFTFTFTEGVDLEATLADAVEDYGAIDLFIVRVPGDVVYEEPLTLDASGFTAAVTTVRFVSTTGAARQLPPLLALGDPAHALRVELVQAAPARRTLWDPDGDTGAIPAALCGVCALDSAVSVRAWDDDDDDPEDSESPIGAGPLPTALSPDPSDGTSLGSYDPLIWVVDGSLEIADVTAAGFVGPIIQLTANTTPIAAEIADSAFSDNTAPAIAALSNVAGSALSITDTSFTNNDDTLERADALYIADAASGSYALTRSSVSFAPAGHQAIYALFATTGATLTLSEVTARQPSGEVNKLLRQVYGHAVLDRVFVDGGGLPAVYSSLFFEGADAQVTSSRWCNIASTTETNVGLIHVVGRDLLVGSSVERHGALAMDRVVFSDVARRGAGIIGAGPWGGGSGEEPAALLDLSHLTLLRSEDPPIYGSEEGSVEGSVRLVSSLLSNASFEDSAPAWEGGSADIDYNLFFESDGPGTLGSANALLDTDPLLLEVDDGRPCAAPTPQAGSPATDAGDPRAAYNDPDGSRGDIGAIPTAEGAAPDGDSGVPAGSEGGEEEKLAYWLGGSGCGCAAAPPRSAPLLLGGLSLALLAARRRRF